MNVTHLIRSTAVGVLCSVLCSASAAPIKALIVDGQNNHDWKSTTPVLKRILEDTGLFAVDVATAPAKQQEMGSYRPAFKNYRVVIGNYNGMPWSAETQQAFVDYMQSGGGLVVFHAADNSWPEWQEWNEMIGLGGWGGRNEKSGPYLRLRDGKFVPDTRPGAGGSHGAQHEFVLETRAPEHPIMAGLPARWLHAKDELYDRLRGPAKNVTVLASAFADRSKGGSGEHEPQLFTINYGKGRVFHTAMGHDGSSMRCVGFATTLQRGAEWAATGKVTQPVPANFPTETKVSLRP